MARSNKPLVWGPFAAGGTLTAFLTPALMLLTLLAALGYTPGLFEYGQLRAFAGNWLAKLALAATVFLTLWSAAHRLRITAHDLGIRADALVAGIVYLIAGAGTLAAVWFLVRI